MIFNYDWQRPASILWRVTLVLLLVCIGRAVLIRVVGSDTWLGHLNLLNLDADRNIPNWYSSALMLVAAGLLALIAFVSRNEKGRNHWIALSVIMLVLSLDEAVGLHGRTGIPFRQIFDASGIFYFGWTIVAAPLLVVFGLVFLPWLVRLPRRFRRLFGLSAVIYVSGAFGLEMVGGAIASGIGFGSPAYLIAVTIEESLEIIGLTLFVVVLLEYVATIAPAVTLVSLPRPAGGRTPPKSKRS